MNHFFNRLHIRPRVHMQYSNDVNIANLFVRVSIYILLYHLQ